MTTGKGKTTKPKIEKPDAEGTSIETRGQKVKKAVSREWKFLPLVGFLALFAFSNDKAFQISDNTNFNIALQMAMFAIFAVAIAYVCRRILLHYVDLEEFANKAKEHPIAASVVFASVIYFCVGIFELIGKLMG